MCNILYRKYQLITLNIQLIYNMNLILITLQIFIVLILIIVVFMQKSNDEGLANLTNSNNSAGKKSGMSFLGKVTMVIATIFVINSLVLAKINNSNLKHNKSILHDIDKEYLSKSHTDNNAGDKNIKNTENITNEEAKIKTKNKDESKDEGKDTSKDKNDLDLIPLDSHSNQKEKSNKSK